MVELNEVVVWGCREVMKKIELRSEGSSYGLPGGGVADCIEPEMNCSDRSLKAFIFYNET